MTLAATPPMGWNSWNMFGAQVSAEVILRTADAFLDSGLKAAGYDTIVIDDMWQGGRNESGRLFADEDKFPQGMRALADEIHARGLKLGIYSDAGTQTCGGRPGSQDYEEIDAATFAEWQIDFLKYDWCAAEDTRANAEYRYRRMGDALKATGREIVFSICEWGHHQPWQWGAEAGGHLWRTTGDIGDSWRDIHVQHGLLLGIESIGFEQQRRLARFAGPGRWNDPDMLVVGLRGTSHQIGGAGCTDEEYRTHFALWCMLAAPLMIGCDVASMDEVTRDILTNERLIAINQDALGQQGESVARHGRVEVWSKPLANGDMAVALFNRGDVRQSVRAHWSNIGIAGAWQATDVWSGTDLGVVVEAISAEILPHGSVVVRLSPC